MNPAGSESETLYAEGAELAEQGCWLDALDRLTRAAALQPECAAYQNNAGLANWKAGDAEKAKQYLEAAVRLDPVPPGARVRIHRRLGLGSNLLCASHRDTRRGESTSSNRPGA